MKKLAAAFRRIMNNWRNWAPTVALLLIGVVGTDLAWRAREPYVHDSTASLMKWLYAPAFILYLLAVVIVWRWPNRLGRVALLAIIVCGAAFRLPLIPVRPVFSSDIYRYVWDGRVQAAGINPYRYIPADEHLSQLRDTEIYPNINRKEYAPTVYPPAAQVIFLLTALIRGMSVTAMKYAMFFFEGVTTLFLILIFRRLGLPSHRVLLYLWHPLIVVELAHSGHIDAAMIAMLAVAVWAHLTERPFLTGIFFALATLVKLYPALLFPAFYRKWDWKVPVAAAVTCLAFAAPYLTAGRAVLSWTDHYLDEEDYVSGGRYFVWSRLSNSLPGMSLRVFTVAAAIGLLTTGLVIMFRRKVVTDAFGDILILITVWIVIDSPHFPWYFTWLVFAVALKPRFSCFLLAGLAVLDYLGWMEYRLPGITLTVTNIKFGLFYLAFIVETIWETRAGLDLRSWWQARNRAEVFVGGD